MTGLEAHANAEGSKRLGYEDRCRRVILRQNHAVSTAAARLGLRCIDVVIEDRPNPYSLHNKEADKEEGQPVM